MSYVTLIGEPHFQAGTSELCPQAFSWSAMDVGTLLGLGGENATSASPARSTVALSQADMQVGSGRPGAVSWDHQSQGNHPLNPC